MSTTIPPELSSLSSQVAAEHAEHEAAISAERDAEARVLDRCIEIVRPALRALAGRIKVSRAGEHGSDLPWKEAFYAKRGLCLSGKEPGPESVKVGEWQFSLKGADLVLLEDGSLLELAYAGYYSAADSCPSEWTAQCRAVSVREAMDEWELLPCIEALHGALAAQAGRRVRGAKAARERAAKLEAMLKLLA